MTNATITRPAFGDVRNNHPTQLLMFNEQLVDLFAQRKPEKKNDFALLLERGSVDDLAEFVTNELIAMPDARQDSVETKTTFLFFVFNADDAVKESTPPGKVFAQAACTMSIKDLTEFGGGSKSKSVDFYINDFTNNSSVILKSTGETVEMDKAVTTRTYPSVLRSWDQLISFPAVGR